MKADSIGASPENQGQLKGACEEDQQATQEGEEDEFASAHDCPVSDSVSGSLDRQYGRIPAYSDHVTFSLRALALALVFAVFGAACGGSSSTDAAAPGAAEPSADESDATDAGDSGDSGPDGAAAPADDATTPAAGSDTDAGDEAAIDWDHDWTGDLIGGGQIDATSLAGQDIVLWFWAPW